MITTTSTLEVPGARLYYEVRGAGPLLVLVGAPMDARSFAPLADLLAADHTVLTTDPRGIRRSPVDDPDRDSTPELRADDLARLITALDAGPATVLGSSGGAVTALALVQARPELMGTVIAHEPPLIDLLDDREQLRAETEKQASTYLDGDVLGPGGWYWSRPPSSCRTRWSSRCSVVSGTRPTWRTSTSGSRTRCAPRRTGGQTSPRSERRPLGCSSVWGRSRPGSSATARRRPSPPGCGRC
jgi:pimeloyl-ACP methyl ester carboxylesterase